MSADKREMVKESLIRIAKEVFRKYGFKKTTMDDIALAARRGKTSLYYYYKNKEELFKAVIEDEAANLKNTILGAIEVQHSSEQKFRQYIYTRIEVLNNLASYYDAIRLELFDHLSFINEARKDFDKEEKELVKMILQEGIHKKEFFLRNADATAESIVSILKGLEIQFTVYPEGDSSKDQKVSEIIDLIINGLKYPKT